VFVTLQFGLLTNNFIITSVEIYIRSITIP